MISQLSHSSDIFDNRKVISMIAHSIFTVLHNYNGTEKFTQNLCMRSGEPFHTLLPLRQHHKLLTPQFIASN
jgi:hypothetical protein